MLGCTVNTTLYSAPTVILSAFVAACCGELASTT
jgi:hypothetical protein